VGGNNIAIAIAITPLVVKGGYLRSLPNCEGTAHVSKTDQTYSSDIAIYRTSLPSHPIPRQQRSESHLITRELACRMALSWAVAAYT
jgi:hypothetical protein